MSTYLAIFVPTTVHAFLLFSPAIPQQVSDDPLLVGMAEVVMRAAEK